jgi:hypothetical protein
MSALHTKSLRDCTENTALLTFLFRGATDHTAAVARVSSLGKFGRRGCSVIYILASVV